MNIHIYFLSSTEILYWHELNIFLYNFTKKISNNNGHLKLISIIYLLQRKDIQNNN